MANLADKLKDSINTYSPLLELITHELAAQKPNPLKWSRKEILGHLIDSAANNHQRFVRIQGQEELTFQGYDQDMWVKIQGYQNQKWKDIITLWYQLNMHLASIISLIPHTVLTQSRMNHNLHQIAFKTVPQNECTNLAYFINDYIDHMKQIIEYPYD